MFAPSFGRAVRSTSFTPAVPVRCFCRTTISAAQKPFRPTHQRRLSSSKPSIPPSNKKKPTEELEQNAAAQMQSQKVDAKSEDAVTEIAVAPSSNNIPRVQPTTHQHEDEVKLSSFFALHRPIAFHRETWQQPATMDVFEAVFHRAEPNDVQSMQRTKQTLSDFVQSVYAGIDAAEEMQAEAQYAQQETQHLDGPPTEESIKYHASQMPHFTPPPPPVAFDPFAIQTYPSSAQDVSAAINERITEVTLPSEHLEKPTFRQHVRLRRGGMLLISVKRQRKLKMKKHKYKKLMKRTRLERRKLDRL